MTKILIGKYLCSTGGLQAPVNGGVMDQSQNEQEQAKQLENHICELGCL
jgi:hypothetical protein